MSSDSLSLIVADFESDACVRIEMRQGVCEKPFNDTHAIISPIQSKERIAPDFGTEGSDFSRRDVGEIGDDEVEGADDLLKEITAQAFDLNAEARCVESGEIERVFTDVCEDDFTLRPSFRQTEADASRPCRHVEHTRRWWREFFADDLDECFRFRPWHEGTMIAHELVSAKFDCAEEMLERLPFTTTAEQLTQRGEIGFGHCFVEAQVNIEATAAEDVRNEMLHV